MATGEYSLTPYGKDIAEVMDVFMLDIRHGESPAEIDLNYDYIKSMVFLPPEHKETLQGLLDNMVSMGLLTFTES